MNKNKLHHLWLIFAAYGVWYAVFSGLEEIIKGKYSKAIASLFFGVISYLYIEKIIHNNDKN